MTLVMKAKQLLFSRQLIIRSWWYHKVTSLTTQQDSTKSIRKKHCVLCLKNKKDINNYNDEFLSHFIGKIIVEFYKGDYYCI